MNFQCLNEKNFQAENNQPKKKIKLIFLLFFECDSLNW